MSLKLKSRLGAAAVVLLIGTAGASAAVFDFAGYAASLGEGQWDNQTGGTVTEMGVTLSVDGFNSDGSDVTFGYLDGLSGGLPAGLGACSTVNMTNFQCGTSSDDNIGQIGDVNGNGLEGVELTFSRKVSIVDIMFRDRDHNPLTDFDLLINGSTESVTGGFDFASLGTSSVFSFARANTNRAADFYLEIVTVAPVPLPASMLLLGGALAGLGAIKRRRS